MAIPRTSRWILFGLGLILLAYTVARAILVSFTWDESWTFIHHVLPRMYFQEAHDKMGGNHHLLNVWGMIAAHKLFGSSELALRLPNLLAHALYLYATARIALMARTTVVAVAAFLLLNLHPYLLDFFSLARGYGLACAWMMVALWRMACYHREGGGMRRLVLAASAAMLSAMSHVIMVNFLLAFGLGFLLSWAVQAWCGRRSMPWRQVAALAFIAAIGLAVVLPNALSLSSGGSLNFGCDRFWGCMVDSLGMKFLYHHPYTTSISTMMAMILASVVIVCVVVLLHARKDGWLDQLGPMAFASVVLLACLIAFALQQWWFDVPLPRSRTALFLVPLLFFIPVQGLVAWPAGSRIPMVMACAGCIPLLVHQWRSANLTYAVEWKPEGEVARMLQMIQQDHAPIAELRPIVTLASGFESAGCVPYYRAKDSLQWLNVRPREFPQPFEQSDYYIVEYDGYDRVDTLNWELLYYSEPTGTSLFRDKRWRHPPRVVQRERNDLEAEGTPGRSAEQHVSGAHSVRFDGAVRSTQGLVLTVRDTMLAGTYQLFGSARILQPDDRNWVSLVVRVVRGEEELAKADVNSALQMHRSGEWGPVVVSLRPDRMLLPGDVVHLDAWPLMDNTVMFLDDLELVMLE